MTSHEQHPTNGSVEAFDWQMKLKFTLIETINKKVCNLSFSS